MIQTKQRDGTWRDVFAVSYKPESTAMQVAHNTRRPTRIVQRDKVIFEWSPND